MGKISNLKAAVDDAARRYIEADDSWEKAQQRCLETYDAWHSALEAGDEARRARDQTRKVYRKLSDEYETMTKSATTSIRPWERR